MKTKNITILEVSTDSDSPMIGTLLNVNSNSLGDFTARVAKALGEHFDANEVELIEPEKAFNELFTNQVSAKMRVIVDEEYQYCIQFYETWLY